MLESTVVLPLISEHAEEASFLWLQRSLAVDAPQYGPTQFADLDERLTAQIDGLRVAEQEGWQLANEQVATGEPEDLFPAAVLAIEAGGESLDGVFELVANSREALPGMLSAFGWVSAQFLGGTVSTLLASDLPLRRLVGIAACAMHRKDPGERLPEFFVDRSQALLHHRRTSDTRRRHKSRAPSKQLDQASWTSMMSKRFLMAYVSNPTSAALPTLARFVLS